MLKDDNFGYNKKRVKDVNDLMEELELDSDLDKEEKSYLKKLKELLLEW